MVASRWSVARTVVVAGLVLQFVLTVLQILQSYSVSFWIGRIANREGEAIYGTLALILLLALVVPVARGRRWALALSIVLQLLLTAGMLPWLVRKFTVLDPFVQWFLNLSYCVVGVAAAGFGVVALLEELRRARPARWSLDGAGRGQVALVLVVLSGFLGALAAGAGIAQRPAATSTIAGVPKAVAVLSLDRMAFMPMRLELPAGRTVGLLLVNRATDDHSFDVAAQNVHVRVPPGQTGVALVEVPPSGEIPFYCGLPGHTEAGMTGVIVAR